MKLDHPSRFWPFISHRLGFKFISVERKKPIGNVTFECKFSFKACRMFKGLEGSDSSLVFASLGTVPLTIGSDVGSLEGKSLSKPLSRSITSPNFLSTALDVLCEAAADFNASSAATNTLFTSHWNGSYTSKVKRSHLLNRIEESELCSWAWTKNRHMKISSKARFRYALESGFNDLTNDHFSNSRVEPRAGLPWESIRLDDDRLSSGRE